MSESELQLGKEGKFLYSVYLDHIYQEKDKTLLSQRPGNIRT